MTILQAIIYGIVQGIGEFLPISSTAHLVLVPWLFGWPKLPVSVEVAFDVALHLGTAAAVILFFGKDWLRLIYAAVKKPGSKNAKLFWFVVIATIPGAIFGILLDKYMNVLRAPIIIGVTLIVMGLVLYVADKYSKADIDLEHIGTKRSLAVGIAQVLAIIPGVSRSGVTISLGRYFGIKREDIAKFTFLMSAPIILGDGLWHAKDIIHTPISIAPFIVAIVTAFVVGMLSIKFLLEYLKKNGFAIFAVYRFILGAGVIIIALITSK